MKLPEDKKERTKVLALVGIGAVLVIYGLVVGIVNPLFKGKKERAAKIEALQAKLQKAGFAIARISSDQTSSSNTLSELDEIANRRGLVLRDRLGNFLLGASEIVEAHAKEVGVPIESIQENGISQIPQPSSRTAPGVFNAYTATVRTECGMHDLARLLASLEAYNPYLCISSLTVAAQAGKPEKHAVVFEVQWPIWADPNMPERLAQQIAAMSEGSPANAPAAPADPTGEKKEQP